MIGGKGGDTRVPLIDAAVRPSFEASVRQFKVECLDGSYPAATGRPEISAGPHLDIYVYQSREFLDVWMTTIGKARGAQCFLIVVRDRDGTPALYLPLAIESKFNVRILRFMDGGRFWRPDGILHATSLWESGVKSSAYCPTST
jgi:hypothetical protein